jgi:2-hydroxy-3-oxopropionate reductase
MLTDDYVPGGAVATQIKDLSTANQAAEACGLSLPITQLLEGLFRRTEAAGDRDLDHSALLREIARMNGLSPTHTLMP